MTTSRKKRYRALENIRVLATGELVLAGQACELDEETARRALAAGLVEEISQREKKEIVEVKEHG